MNVGFFLQYSLMFHVIAAPERQSITKDVQHIKSKKKVPVASLLPIFDTHGLSLSRLVTSQQSSFSGLLQA